MRKHVGEIFTVLIIMFLLIASNLCRNTPEQLYKIIKVENTDEFYIDFNRNNKIDTNELVKLYDINAFRPEKSYLTRYQTATTNLTMPEALAIGVLAKEFSEKTFTGKVVKVKLIDIEANKKTPHAKIYIENQEISNILLNEGFAINGRKDNEYKKQLNYVKINSLKNRIKNENILILNLQNNTAHRLECKYAQKLKYAKAIRNNLYAPKSKSINYCSKCILSAKTRKTEPETTPQGPKETFFDFKSGVLSFYFTDFNKRQKPDNNCLTSGCQALLNQINNAKSSIDFAIYGIANQPKIINALVSAQKRGVKVRWVTDADTKGSNIYSEVMSVQKLLPNFKTDNHLIPGETVKNIKYTNSIMHNKFFIFDKEKLWLGSANISQTDLADFNANIIITANSSILAKIYSQEFEQMYNEKFHYLKQPIHNKENLKIDNENTVSVYFSPTDKIIETQIIPEINKAEKYIYISSFIITHYGVKNALLEAKNRGIEIKIITDATSASGKYSIHKSLRDNNIAVKVENKAGKMHTKSLIIDDKLIFIGSMNLTKSGNSKNDENVLLIKNQHAAKIFKNQFLYLWYSIPDKWLRFTPHAEGIDSPGSCSDGIDNDFDGFIDKDDPGCKFAI